MIENMKLMDKKIREESVNISLLLDRFKNGDPFSKPAYGYPQPAKSGTRSNWLILRELVNNLHSHAETMLDLMNCHAEEMVKDNGNTAKE